MTYHITEHSLSSFNVTLNKSIVCDGLPNIYNLILSAKCRCRFSLQLSKISLGQRNVLAKDGIFDYILIMTESHELCSLRRVVWYKKHFTFGLPFLIHNQIHSHHLNGSQYLTVKSFLNLNTIWTICPWQTNDDQLFSYSQNFQKLTKLLFSFFISITH